MLGWMNMETESSHYRGQLEVMLQGQEGQSGQERCAMYKQVGEKEAW